MLAASEDKISSKCLKIDELSVNFSIVNHPSITIMPLESTLRHDRRQDVVVPDDCMPEEFKSIKQDAETVLYVMDGCFRHSKVVIRPNDTDRLSSLVLSMISKNKQVTIIPSSRLLDIEEVIHILGASPTYVEELDEAGTLKFFKHGLSYVVEAEKVVTLKEQLQKDMEKGCDELIEMDQELYFYDS